MSDTKTACKNFFSALERLPEIIRQYEERAEKMRKDVPLLEAIIAKSWGKEDELKQLKSDLAALDRKITAALAPKKEEQDGEEVKRDDEPQQSHTVESQTHSTGNKESMVAEPFNSYVHPIIVKVYDYTHFGSIQAAGPKL